MTFADRFPDMTASVFYGSGQESLSDYTPTQSPINTGMLADIGRATVWGPETQQNPFARFMRNPLTRGEAAMTARFSEALSHAYDPLVGDSALFDGTRPSMLSNVAKKNLSRQIRVEISERLMKQFVQTPEMIGDAQAAIMAVSNACYMDDMYAASVEYFGGSTRGARNDQMITLTNDIDDAGFAAEMTEKLWTVSQKNFGYKSTKYNKSQANTRAPAVAITMAKDAEFPTFKKLLSETFNPDYLRVASDIQYVDEFPSAVAGKPAGAGDLVAIVCDTRAFDIVPMPEALTVESFRNPARKSTAYFTTYEYAFGHNPFFDCAYIFAPGA